MAAAAAAAAAAALAVYAWWQYQERRRRSGGAMTAAEALAATRQLFCPAQSLSYANTGPLMLVDGQGAYLYDEHGTAYLDTRNVSHLLLFFASGLAQSSI